MNSPPMRLIGLLALLASLPAASAIAGSAPPDREALVQKLQDREKQIVDLSGECKVRQHMSAEQQAGIANWEIRKFALKQGVDGLRERRMESMLYGKDGQKDTTTHRLIAFDGRQHYLFFLIPEPHERRVAQVTVGRDIRPQFDRECVVAILMGLCMPDCEGSLSNCITAYDGTVSGPIPIDGTPCTQVRFTRPKIKDKPADRFTVLLDPRHGLAIRKIEIETFLPESSRWVTNFRWEVQELRQESRTKVWYPVEIKEAFIANSGDTIMTTDYAVQDLKINSGLASAIFTPEIEDGSNVTDARTGLGYVAGGRVSPRIKKFLEESAEEARQEIAAASAGPLRTVPEVTANRSVGWLIVLFGTLLLIVAAVWQWRLRSGERC